MTENEDLLDALLSAASEELENCSSKNEKYLRDTDIFQCDSNLPETADLKVANKSVVHSGDTDSSDEESNRNYENQKYNECGKDVKNLLSTGHSSFSGNSNRHRSSDWKKKPGSSHSPTLSKITSIESCKPDVYSDPIFGLRIVNPLISSMVLQERMAGREAVSLARLSRHVQFKGQDSDWVIAGIVVNKSSVKTSQKGNQYSIWTLSDLKDDIKTVVLFLFGSAHNQLWKTVVGTVIGVLNPNVLDRREGSKDEASLSVDNAQRVMIMGQSKDFGTCRSMKKNGEKCTAIVNKSRCEFCLYHIKQEYQKCSKRSELQANFSGGGLTALRNKVLGKNEVFYAGKSYMAIPSKKSKKLELKDTNRLESLNGIHLNSNNIVKAKTKSLSKKKQNAARLEVSHAQRLRDLDLLKKLGVVPDMESKTNFSGIRSSDITLEESKSTAISVINKLKAKKTELKSNPPKEDFKNGPEEQISELTRKKDSIPLNNMETSKFPLEKNLNSNNKSEREIVKHSEISKKLHDKKSTPDKETMGKTPDSINKTPGSNSNFDSPKSNRPLFKTNENENSPGLMSPINFSSKINGSSMDTPRSISLTFPSLSRPGSDNFIDLNKQITPRPMSRAKQNAIKLIQKNGPIKKADPNNIKGTGTKRLIEDGFEINPAKKSKLVESGLISDRFKKMMAATSSHMDLLEARDDEEKEKYFNKLEAKERMEEKMTSTYKLACKAVRCLICKYTSFSASDLCKSEKHPLKVFDAMKRFFKCGNCGNRTVSLEIIPTRPCTNCGSGKWERTGMMKEKVVVAAHSLSIRGGEQKYMNSVATDANINLLVPDAD
ncbi:hypothetical protein JTB14_023665 [Gonioctena quinquepunctata]|nr:hypothetical protein JTB14_023665 [Gonioctena quinquepunctata]